jgi:parallel beta-helix repeat protein
MQNKAIWKPLMISIILMIVATNIVVGADLVNKASNLKWNEEEPELYVHPTYLDFGEMRTGETASNSFYVENTGGGLLEWEIDCDSWIDVSPSSGCLYGGDGVAVEVEIDTSSLDGGKSGDGDICVTSNGGDAGVCVIVYVEEEPELYVHPTYLDFGEMETGDTAWASFYVENTGGGVLEWGAGWDMDWIEVYHDYGLLNGGDRYEVEVEIDTTNLEEGESGSIYLTSNGGAAEVCVEVKIEGRTPIYHLPIYPPIASFTYVPQSPITIMFDASCSYDPDGTIVDYNWDFGDGVMGSGITYNHTYIVNGTYTVKLTVIDNDYSTDTITYNVTITNVTSYDICDFINDLGLENITFAHLISLVKLFRYGSLDSIPPEHRPNGVIKNLTEDDINAVVAYIHGEVVLGNYYAKKSCGRDCIALSEKNVHNLNTGENFSKIQAAIDDKDTKDGHTITVYSGVYYENVVVDKSLILIGNSQPVVDAGGEGSAITLCADGITLIGFTTTNSGREIGAGITVTSCNNIITGNNASSNDDGISFWYSSNNIITGNDIRSNNDNGIYLSPYSSNNILTGNNVSNNDNGICLVYSNNNTITGNTFFSNGIGIYLFSYSNNNTITGNTHVNDGLSVYKSCQNTVKDNTVNGKHLVYLEDASDYKVEDAGQVILVNCSNITVENLDLSNTHVGIELWKTEDSIISNNTLSNNDNGIILDDSSNNILTGNNASSNDVGIFLSLSSNNILTGNNASSNDVGIFLSPYSSNNILTGNNISNSYNGIFLSPYSSNNILTGNNISNSYNGICLEYSNNNTITGNTFFSNDVGIYLSYSSNNNTIAGNNASNNRDGIALRNSSNNKIYLSNLINNTDNVYSHKSTNIWNSTEKITYTYNGSTYTDYLGNYWSDYEEKYPDAEAIDTTGIWDTPYNIGEDKDIYPLLERFENYCIICSPIVHPPAAEPIIAPGDNFTEFYILCPNGTASGYPTNLTVGEDGKEIIGIVNHEYTNVTYQLEVWLSGELIGGNSIALKHNETWESPFTFRVVTDIPK